MDDVAIGIKDDNGQQQELEQLAACEAQNSGAVACTGQEQYTTGGRNEKANNGVGRNGQDWSDRPPRCVASPESNNNEKAGISTGDTYIK